MALLPNNMQFDATNVEPNGNIGPLPPGNYNVIIKGSEIKPTKSNPQHFYLEFTYEVTEGKYKNRLIWDRLNIVNSNEMTQNIAYGTLSAICRGAQVMNIGQDTAVLHGKMLQARVGIQKDNSELNEVKGYSTVMSPEQVQAAETAIANYVPPAPTQQVEQPGAQAQGQWGQQQQAPAAQPATQPAVNWNQQQPAQQAPTAPAPAPAPAAQQAPAAAPAQPWAQPTEAPPATPAPAPAPAATPPPQQPAVAAPAPAPAAQQPAQQTAPPSWAQQPAN